jgi:hypothetical protein
VGVGGAEGNWPRSWVHLRLQTPARGGADGNISGGGIQGIAPTPHPPPVKW